MFEKKLRRFGSTELVRSDFVFGEGFAKDYRFLEKSYPGNPFGREIYVPIMHFLKVDAEHPIRITISKENDIKVYPEEELCIKNPRSELEVYEDEMVYNLTTFMIVPYRINGISWEDLPIYESSTLLYSKHGSSMESEDLRKVSRVTSSQVFLRFQRWLRTNNSFFLKGENGKFKGECFTALKDEHNFSYALFKGIERLQERYRL